MCVHVIMIFLILYMKIYEKNYNLFIYKSIPTHIIT